MEVRALLPTMLRAAQVLCGELDEVLLIEAPGVSSAVDRVLAEGPPDVEIRRCTGPQRRAELAASGVAWTASGTATLECALLGVPMVVGYRLHRLTYALARRLVQVPHVALVNLIAERRAAPELIQDEWVPERLVRETRRLLGPAGAVQRRHLATVRQRLGEPGASQRAASAVCEHLERAIATESHRPSSR